MRPDFGWLVFGWFILAGLLFYWKRGTFYQFMAVIMAIALITNIVHNPTFNAVGMFVMTLLGAYYCIGRLKRWFD